MDMVPHFGGQGSSNVAQCFEGPSGGSSDVAPQFQSQGPPVVGQEFTNNSSSYNHSVNRLPSVPGLTTHSSEPQYVGNPTVQPSIIQAVQWFARVAESLAIVSTLCRI